MHIWYDMIHFSMKLMCTLFKDENGLSYYLLKNTAVLLTSYLSSPLLSPVSSQLHWSEETGRTVLSFLVRWTGWLADWRDWRPRLVGWLALHVTIFNQSPLDHHESHTGETEAPLSVYYAIIIGFFLSHSSSQVLDCLDLLRGRLDTYLLIQL